MDVNNLICWIENNEKHWDMIKDSDRNTFLLNLMQKKGVDLHSIFIVPTNGFIQGIWLWTETHKSNRVDFWNFHKDLGTKYEKPEPVNETSAKIAEDVQERSEDNDSTKYGYISPDGRYYHCGYQGHNALACRICFGMAETNNSEKYLEEHGWLKIYKPFTEGKYSVYVGKNHCITDAQMRVLIDMELDNAHGVSSMLTNDERDF